MNALTCDDEGTGKFYKERKLILFVVHLQNEPTNFTSDKQIIYLLKQIKSEVNGNLIMFVPDETSCKIYP